MATKQILLGAFIVINPLLTNISIAAPIEKSLLVSTHVVVSQISAELEIVAPRSDFIVVYLPSLNTFQPLNIPFSVKQIDGGSHRYELSLAQLTGQCTISGVLTPSATLDGLPFPANGIANPEQAHVLRLTFPIIPQSESSQRCEGVAAVVASVVI